MIIKDNITGIYKITSPSGRIYIGSSKNIKRRKTYYESGNCKGQIRLYYSIQKYGFNAHLFEILEECNLDNLYERERFYGDMFDVLGFKGLNSILPKNGETKVGVSEETRLKMSQIRLGSNNHFYGKTHNQKTKDKIRTAQLGRKHSLEHRLKVSINNAKILAKIVLDLNTGVFYESCKEAAFYFGFKHSTLKSQLNGTNKNSTSLIYC